LPIGQLTFRDCYCKDTTLQFLASAPPCETIERFRPPLHRMNISDESQGSIDSEAERGSKFLTERTQNRAASWKWMRAIVSIALATLLFVSGSQNASSDDFRQDSKRLTVAGSTLQAFCEQDRFSTDNTGQRRFHCGQYCLCCDVTSVGPTAVQPAVGATTMTIGAPPSAGDESEALKRPDGWASSWSSRAPPPFS
jgi:hypothetical protein